MLVFALLNSILQRQFSMLKQQSDQNTKFPALTSADRLRITAITWNLFGSIPPQKALDQLFSHQDLQQKSDVIFIGSQECQRSLFASFCCESKQLWEQRLTDTCNTHFLAASHTMRGLHIAILVRRSLKDYFEFQNKQKMRAGGPCGVMGNKGAISIQFSILGQQFQFINCHLAAHQHECPRRNETIHRILQQVIRKDGEVIFLGDFNYRIQMEKIQYREMMAGRVNTDAEMDYTSLFHRDQLNTQKELKGTFLAQFQEGEITFPPTYKLGVNNAEYCKERIPGWTDRIFHRKSKKLTRKQYNCGYQILGCDHRPVFAFFEHPLEDNAFEIGSEQFIGVKSGNCQLI